MQSLRNVNTSFCLAIVFFALALWGTGCRIFQDSEPKEELIHLDGVTSLAILDIECPRDPRRTVDCSLTMEEELTQAILAQGRFQIMARRRLDEVLKLKNLQSSDFFDPRTGAAQKAGELAGVQALIVGRVQRYEFLEEPVKEEKFKYFWRWLPGIDEKEHTEFTRLGTAHLAVYFEVIDLGTGQLFGSQTIKPRARLVEKSAIDNIRELGPLDAESAFRHLRLQAVEEFASLLIP